MPKLKKKRKFRLVYLGSKQLIDAEIATLYNDVKNDFISASKGNVLKSILRLRLKSYEIEKGIDLQKRFEALENELMGKK